MYSQLRKGGSLPENPTSSLHWAVGSYGWACAVLFLAVAGASGFWGMRLVGFGNENYKKNTKKTQPPLGWGFGLMVLLSVFAMWIGARPQTPTPILMKDFFVVEIFW